MMPVVGARPVVGVIVMPRDRASWGAEPRPRTESFASLLARQVATAKWGRGGRWQQETEQQSGFPSLPGSSGIWLHWSWPPGFPRASPRQDGRVARLAEAPIKTHTHLARWVPAS